MPSVIAISQVERTWLERTFLLSGREPGVTVRASRDGVKAEMPVASIVGVRVGSEYGSAR